MTREDVFFGRGGSLRVVSLRVNASVKKKKQGVVFVLFESVATAATLWRLLGKEIGGFEQIGLRAPTFRGGTAAPYSNMRGRFV